MAFDEHPQSFSESPASGGDFMPSPVEEKKLELSIDSAVQFQGALFARYFVDEKNKAKIFEDQDVMANLMWKYAKAFRDYCDMHQEVVREILYCNDNIDALPPEMLEDMIAYIKAHPVSDEDIEAGGKDLDKYKVSQVH